MTVEIASQQQENPASLLRESLKKVRVPYFPFGVGADAFLITSDRINTDILTKVKDREPDGYLVGVGFGGLLTFLNCFSSEKKPKGIIAVDINPQVVIAGRFMIEMLKTSNTHTEFIDRFFNADKNTYIREFIRIGKEDKKVKKQCHH